jgi:hypothetical protein
VIRYTEDMTAIAENMLGGFFVGWPRYPSAAQHLALLRGSFRSVAAVDDSAGRGWRQFRPGQGNRSGLRAYNRHGSPTIG